MAPTEEPGLEEIIEDQKLEEEPIENCEISLEAMNGSRGYKTLRIQGFTKQKPINVFIDCAPLIILSMNKQQKGLGARFTK